MIALNLQPVAFFASPCGSGLCWKCGRRWAHGTRCKKCWSLTMALTFLLPAGTADLMPWCLFTCFPLHTHWEDCIIKEYSEFVASGISVLSLCSSTASRQFLQLARQCLLSSGLPLLWDLWILSSGQCTAPHLVCQWSDRRCMLVRFFLQHFSALCSKNVLYTLRTCKIFSIRVSIFWGTKTMC